MSRLLPGYPRYPPGGVVDKRKRFQILSSLEWFDDWDTVLFSLIIDYYVDFTRATVKLSNSHITCMIHISEDIIACVCEYDIQFRRISDGSLVMELKDEHNRSSSGKISRILRLNSDIILTRCLDGYMSLWSIPESFSKSKLIEHIAGKSRSNGRRAAALGIKEGQFLSLSTGGELDLWEITSTAKRYSSACKVIQMGLKYDSFQRLHDRFYAFFNFSGKIDIFELEEEKEKMNMKFLYTLNTPPVSAPPLHLPLQDSFYLNQDASTNANDKAEVKDGEGEAAEIRGQHLLAIAAIDKNIHIYDYVNNQLVRTLKGESMVHELGLLEDNRFIAMSLRKVDAWDWKTGSCIQTFSCNFPMTSMLGLSANVFAVADNIGYLRFYMLSI